MRFTKLKVSSEATSRLRSLQQRTSLTPNILCRLAITLSLEEGALGASMQPDDHGMEFNAYSLTGEAHDSFVAMVTLVEDAARPPNTDPLRQDELLVAFRAHIERGVTILAGRVKSLGDVARLATTSGS